MMSFGSGATVTSKTWGFEVRGVLAAVVSEVRSRNVIKPVDDIPDPMITVSKDWSKNHRKQRNQ